MILVLRLMQLKCTEHNRGLYASFVDILGLKVKEGGGGRKQKQKGPTVICPSVRTNVPGRGKIEGKKDEANIKK